MSKFQEMFMSEESPPVGKSVLARWASACPGGLDGACERIARHGASPWAFAADARHFHRVAEEREYCALLDMTLWERNALLGWAEEEEFDAAAFGYSGGGSWSAKILIEALAKRGQQSFNLCPR